jgi:integrase
MVSEGIARGMQYREIKQKLSEYFAEAIKRKKARMEEAGRLSSQEIENYRYGVSYGTEGFSLGLENDPQLKSLFDWSGLEVTKGSKDYDTIRAEYERAYSSFCQHLLDYDRSLGAYDFEPKSSLVASTNAPESDSKSTLREVVGLFVAEQQLGGKHWVAKTEGEKLQHFELLQEILGPEIIIKKISGEDARRVKTTLINLPKNRNKLVETRELSLADVLALDNIEKLSITTINKYLQSYSGLFSWAKQQSFVENNFFDGLEIRAKKSKDDLRDAFKQHEIQAILREIVHNDRGLINKDYQKWGPLIAIYTGARLNEIAQLRLDDIKNEDGLYYFDLNESDDGKRLKNAASARRVPVHSRLISLGLLEHIGDMQRKGKTRLFPDFPYSEKNGYGRNLSQWFNNVFLPELGLKSKQLVFHSLRHTVITELMHASVEEPIVKAIVGHTRAGVTQQNYFKQGYTLVQLATALEKLK